jgi:hypothetical protein
MTSDKAFGGAGKVGESMFSPWERRFVARYVTKVPRWLETYHLTMLTVVWCLGILFFGWMAQRNILVRDCLRTSQNRT